MAEIAVDNSRADQRYSTRLMVLPAILSLISGIAGLTMATHYPLVPAVVTALLFLVGVASFAWPNLWLLLLPALLPVTGLAPWTGWITFEELDILILAVAFGSYARMAWSGRTRRGAAGVHSPRQGLPVVTWPLIGAFGLSVAVSMFRGFSDAGGFSFGWFQGYHEPMNSARLVKSFFLAVLLLPLWQTAHGQNPTNAQNLLSQGLMLGLATAALTALWERLAFPGLLNFSADYRTTGMFWEMHVGGAALDGFLALCVPFALREFLISRTPARWFVAASVLALASYACLTTFSRGVYLAIPAGAAVFGYLHNRQQRQLASNAPAQTQAVVADTRKAPAVWVLVGFGAGAAWMFQSSGYRGMAALLVTMTLMLPLAGALRRMNLNQWMVGMTTGGVLILLAGAVAWFVPKGAYVAWALASVLTAAMLALFLRGAPSASFTGPMALGGFFATATGTALVAYHWGETTGLRHAAPVLFAVLFLGVAAGAGRKPFWPESLRWQATMAGIMGMIAAIVGIFGGGAYMGERLSTGERDFAGRIAHWQLGRDMLHTPSDWLLGKGLGRFPVNYFLVGNPSLHPGDYRIKQEDGNNYLTLTGGLHMNGWGEIFRVTQRITEPETPLLVTANVRADRPVTLHFEICEKHLLYSQGCVIRQAAIKGAPGVWQAVRLELQGNGVSRGDWYAPRLLAFSMAVESRGGLIALDNVALVGADGRQLLTNGDFSEDMANWFFSSDRHHLPWHIKSLFMNVLFEQGLVGAIFWSLLLTGALWRTSLGSARSHPLAPALAASLIGFGVVGLFDSLLDVPRLACLFYLLLLMALTLTLRDRTRSPSGAPHHSGATQRVGLSTVLNP